MFVWQAHEGPFKSLVAVTSLAFGPGGQFLVSAGADECVKVWEPFTGAEQFSLSLHADNARAPRRLVVSGDGCHAVVDRPGRELAFLDLVGKVENFALSLPDIRAMKAAPDGMSLFVITADVPNGTPHLRQFDFEGKALQSPIGLPIWRGPRAIGISSDCSRVAAGVDVFEWPPRTSYPVKGGLDTKDYTPEDLAFSADNQHLFALVGGKVVVYSLPDGLFKTKLKGHNGKITAMALAPDGRRLWTASRDATVKCWDTHSLTLDRTFTFQTGGLDCLAVSPDGNVAAVGSGQKGTITVWDLG